MRWLVVACAAGALLATRTDVYEPLPAGVPQAAVIACIVALPLAFGLAVARWWAVVAALCLLIQPDVRNDPVFVVFLAAAMVAVAVLIAIGVGLARMLPRWRPLAVPLALIGLLPLAVGAYRTIQPYDHVPDQRLVVDERSGRVGSVRLGDRQAPESRKVASGVTAYAEDGRVRGISSANPDAQTSKGVGNGDSLALVEERYPSARCIVEPAVGEYAESRYCVLLVGDVEIQFREDPIRRLTVQRSTP